MSFQLSSLCLHADRPTNSTGAPKHFSWIAFEFAFIFSVVSLPTRFDHCVVHVSDWERSNTFYRDVVGVELISKNGRWAYRFENAQLNLHGPGVEAKPLARIPVPAGRK